MRPIQYGRQEITDEDIEAVVATLKSDFLTQGPAILKFEKEFAQYVDAKYAVAVANGTAALHLSSLALGVAPGMKVITTPITFAATANCVLYAGGEIDFVDIDPNTYLINLSSLRRKLEDKPIGYYGGVIPVSFAGYPVDLEELRNLCDEFGLWIIEDACHAPGGYFLDSKNAQQKCGNGAFADLSIFSFHPVKHIATGEGGMISTNNNELYEKLLSLRSHGITKNPVLMKENHGGWYYEMQELGYNYRITDIQAALGSSQLKKADKGLERRKEIAKKYNEAFSSNLNIKIPFLSEKVSHAFHLYVIQIEDRYGLYNYLKSQQIFPQVHYIPIHLLSYYRKKGWKENDFPVAENYYEKCLSLPMYPSLTMEEQQYIIEKVNEFFTGTT